MSEQIAPYDCISPDMQADFDRIKALSRSETDSAWVFAQEVSGVIGKYQRGVTKSLADYIGLSPDSVENYAHAWKLYDEFRQAPYDDFSDVAKLREDLRISHFIHAAKLRVKYNADLYQTYGWLLDCITLDPGRVLSVKGMIQNAEADMLVRGQPVDWRRFYLPKLEKLARQMLTFPDLPAPLQTVLRWVVEWKPGQKE